MTYLTSHPSPASDGHSATAQQVKWSSSWKYVQGSYATYLASSPVNPPVTIETTKTKARAAN